MTTCPICTAELPPAEGPGRPPVYCGIVCRRHAEFELRRIGRRLENYELELREAELGFDKDGFATVTERDKVELNNRTRALRRWIKADQRTLRRLLGEKESNGNQRTGQKAAETPLQPTEKA